MSSNGKSTAESRESEGCLRSGALALDQGRRSATLHGNPLRLGAREFLALQVLMESPGQIVAAPAIFAAAWGNSDAGDLSKVRGVIHRLRQKLRPGRLIETIGAEGYRLVCTNERERA